jgi:hypothetical protein
VKKERNKRTGLKREQKESKINGGGKEKENKRRR